MYFQFIQTITLKCVTYSPYYVLCCNRFCNPFTHSAPFWWFFFFGITLDPSTEDKIKCCFQKCRCGFILTVRTSWEDLNSTQPVTMSTVITLKKFKAQRGVSNNPKHVSINRQRAAPTEYSGNCRRKKQARTSSQWKVPLWVPIFVTVMFSVQSLFGSLDMQRVSPLAKCTGELKQLTRENTLRDTPAVSLVTRKYLFFVNLSAKEKTRTTHIQRVIHETRQWRTGLTAGPDVLLLFRELKMPGAFLLLSPLLSLCCLPLWA